MFVTILLLILTSLLLYLGCRKPKGYPPGPRWWPVLGCLLEVKRIREETGHLVQSLSALSKKYGPVVGLKIGNDRIVILNDLESMRAILTNEDCEGRPNGPIYKIRTWGLRRGLLLVDEHFWIEQRRFVLRHLKEFGFGRANMATIIENEALKLVRHFKKLLQNSRDYDKSKTFTTLTSGNNISRIYELQKNSKHKTKSKLCGEFDVIENETPVRKSWTVSDLYVKFSDYETVERASRSDEMIIRMDDAFGVTVLSTLWNMMAGRSFDTDDKELTHLQRILGKLLGEIDMIGAPFSHFPILRFIAPEMSGYNKFVQTHQELWAFLNKEICNHKETFVPNAPRDMMDVYLAMLNSENCSDTFSESQLLAICMDFFMAGSETTSKTLSFGFLSLMLYPEVQRKAHEEIDRVLGRDKFPTLADKVKMPYMQAIVMEALRIFAAYTLVIPHRALRDTTILGYNIPKDTMLIVNFNRMLMDESWGDPDTFRPERFLDNDNNIVTPEKFSPFGIGKHRCMGEMLAKSNIFLIMVALLQTFSFSVVPGEPRPSMHDIADGVTSGPKPYRALVTLRT